MKTADTIRAIIAQRLNRSPEEITDDSELVQIGLDSLDLLEVIFEIETQLNIDLPYNANNPGELGLTTVGEVIQKIEAEIGER